jgi:tRNA (guanine37-N1)-methyltransferase
LRIDVVTLFPQMFEGPLGASIVGRARKAGVLELGFANPRDFAEDRRRTVDDRPYGGGPGMVMTAEPLRRAVRSVKKRGAVVAFLSPSGRRFDQALAEKLSKRKRLVLVCGRYEGVDERFVESEVDLEISFGDFVLTGGEIAAMAVVDAVTRLLPGALHDPGSAKEESFSDEAGLEYPQYTRPRVWRRMRVPEVLLSGDHDRVRDWREKQASLRTRKRRPDLIRRDRR